MHEQRFIPVVPASETALEARLKRELEGEVLFDAFTRGRYATDASIYQVAPIGVVVPRTTKDVALAIQIAADAKVPVLPRGAGTSQCGQTVGEALVIDNSKYLNNVRDFDATAQRITVEPGIVLDQLNKYLRSRGLFFPIDPSTASRATIGGMAGNNSCGARSIRYGNMVHNVHAIEVILASGETARFSEVPADLDELRGPAAYIELVKKLRELYAREADEITARFPKLLRRVAGYNIDMISQSSHNMAQLLVGSEGTLCYFTELELELKPIPRHKVLGVCHFPRFYDAMDNTRHLIKLDPAAVELVDRTMIDLARGIPQFRATVDRFLKGEPDALLLVEFAGEDKNEQVKKLKELVSLMGDLGFPESVVEIVDPAFQKDTWEVRKSGLNIMMSMKGDGKPVSFIEDCAVPLEDLAEYTDRLTRVFEKHGTKGTWYAHASVGCLHVRPVLNMKTEDGARQMRAIAEEACAMVREYKGAYSGEHGDGIVRSEWIEPMLGSRIVRALEDVKRLFDPNNLFNPGKIVRAPKMDDRALFRFKPGYQVRKFDTALDWSSWGGLGGAVEMCNNNGACRKFEPGTMCPSYRATRDEQHLTRGRANSLRLALSGQLGPDAFTSDAMYETLDLCVSCKGCKRECPTGVDIAKMKIEFLYHYRKEHPLNPKEKLIAYLPRYAPRASRFAAVLNLRDALPGLAGASQQWLGFSAKRSLPKWRRDAFSDSASPRSAGAGWEGGASSQGARRAKGEVVLLVDTFNRYFEPENAHAALAVLRAAGYRVHLPELKNERPLCCGRTFLSCGLVDEAKLEARRMLSALKPYVERNLPIIGIEPSCLLTLRDEFGSMLPSAETAALAERALLIEEFLATEHNAHRLDLRLKPLPEKKALLHGHCHQKAFAVMPQVEKTLGLVPGLAVEMIDSSCCGMAGAFGYETSHYDVSMKMAELSLLPKVREAAAETLIVADGVSCRHQIKDGAGRQAIHVARVLQAALA